MFSSLHGPRDATGIINVAGEHLQSVRSAERCLALDIILLAGKIHNKAANACILDRINYLLWNDSNLNVRTNAGNCLNFINAGYVVYNDLLDKFSSIDTSTNRLWCLSVVRKLKIITAQILPCYIKCFNDKEHADVRLLACQIAHELNLKSDTVYHKLVDLAQSDSSDFVKAAAIKSLTNFDASKDVKLIKLLCWAVTFENNAFVRLAAINAIESMRCLKPLTHEIDLEMETRPAGGHVKGANDASVDAQPGGQLAIEPPKTAATRTSTIQNTIEKLSNFEAIKELKERAIIEQNTAVKSKIRQVLKEQAGIICKDSDLKELQIIKEQVGNLCTKDKVIELLMAS